MNNKANFTKLVGKRLLINEGSLMVGAIVVPAEVKVMEYATHSEFVKLEQQHPKGNTYWKHSSEICIIDVLSDLEVNTAFDGVKAADATTSESKSPVDITKIRNCKPLSNQKIWDMANHIANVLKIDWYSEKDCDVVIEDWFDYLEAQLCED